MRQQTAQLYQFLEDRYIWQLRSDSWDREANFNPILNQLSDILTGEKTAAPDCIKDKAYMAEANGIAYEASNRMHWITELEKDQVESIIKQLKDRLIHAKITREISLDLPDPDF